MNHPDRTASSFFRHARDAAVLITACSAIASASAAPQARTLVPTEVFNYAERQYPALFPVHEQNRSYPPYTYRYYAQTGNYLALAEGTVFLLGPVSGGELHAVGPASSFYCAVAAPECSRAPLSLPNDRGVLTRLAARSIDAPFMYQTIIKSLALDVIDLLQLEPVGLAAPKAELSGRLALPCVNGGGTGSVDVVDADDSHTLSVGDQLRVRLNNCVMVDASNHPLATGEFTLTVTSGTNVHNYVADESANGAVEYRVEVRNLSQSRGVLDGVFRFGSSWTSAQADYTEMLGFEDFTATTREATMRFADVKLVFTNHAKKLSTFEGVVIVDCAETPQHRLQLSVPTAPDVDQTTIRPRPTSGVLRAQAHGYTVDVVYRPVNREVMLYLDNGSDGSNEITHLTTEAALNDVLAR